jgi:hypothetical protein
MFLHSALHCSRKISMFSAMKKRHFSGTLVMEECQSLVGAKLRHQERSREAGFSSVRRVPLGNPFNNLYELQP